MTHMEKYAELIIRTGVHVQPGQILVITASIELPEFVRMCTLKAYEAGASQVVVRWTDEQSDRLFYDMAADHVFDQVDEWKVLQRTDYAEKDAAFLSILSDDPEIMKGVDPSKLSRLSKAYAKPLKPYTSKMMSNRVAWCVVSMPTKAWASKVFPDLETEDAMEALWQAIIKSTRVDTEDPVAAWADHQAYLDSKLSVLNKAQFKAFNYSNLLGTNLRVELPDNHLWFGGADTHTDKGYKFVANMPTEEIFSAPKRDGVHGRVVASYPLVYNGVKIEDFWLEFKDGLVVDYGARKNQAILKELLNMDEGAKRLGEIALVPYDSPISNQKILFYETLFDENAACHFALGEAYPICVKDGETMTEDGLKAAGLNVSDVHVDFMVGTEDLTITGIHEDGREVPIFINGNYAY